MMQLIQISPICALTSFILPFLVSRMWIFGLLFKKFIQFFAQHDSDKMHLNIPLQSLIHKQFFIFLLFGCIYLRSFLACSASFMSKGSEFNNRSSKWLPFIVIIGNEQCNSSDSHEVGTCFTSAQCRRTGGSPKGKCASGFGVCCVIVSSCDDTISNNNTYFRNEEFPDPIKPKGHQVCSTKIIKPNADVCQVLLTFHEMELVKGDMNGHCLIDNINIFGMTNIQLPHLCGPLSKQHMYLEFGRGSKITFSISIDGFQDDVGRKWNVQVSYIRCNDPFRAPSGCLQYYTASTGTVKMLGYPEIPHLAGLQYTICVRRALAAESIFWFPCRDVDFDKSFHLQGPNVFTTGLNLIWISCTGDYITIMSDDGTSHPMSHSPKDRYCGNRLTNFPPFYVNSKATPYIIVVRTDLIEFESDVDNIGFCLEWYQVIWKPSQNSPGMPVVFPPAPEEGP